MLLHEGPTVLHEHPQRSVRCKQPSDDAGNEMVALVFPLFAEKGDAGGRRALSVAEHRRGGLKIGQGDDGYSEKLAPSCRPRPVGSRKSECGGESRLDHRDGKAVETRRMFSELPCEDVARSVPRGDHHARVPSKNDHDTRQRVWTEALLNPAHDRRYLCRAGAVVDDKIVGLDPVEAAQILSRDMGDMVEIRQPPAHRIRHRRAVRVQREERQGLNRSGERRIDP